MSPQVKSRSVAAKELALKESAGLYPSLYQINTRVLMQELGKELGRPATLHDISDGYLDRLSQQNFDSQWIAINAKDALNASGAGAFFNVLNFGQMYGFHVVLMPAAITGLVVVFVPFSSLLSTHSSLGAAAGGRAAGYSAPCSACPRLRGLAS